MAAAIQIMVLTVFWLDAILMEVAAGSRGSNVPYHQLNYIFHILIFTLITDPEYDANEILNDPSEDSVWDNPWQESSRSTTPASESGQSEIGTDAPTVENEPSSGSVERPSGSRNNNANNQ